MIIYPAIDLRAGKCVRLYQGDYQQETVYASDPKARLATFVNEGADWIHLIDLDGAKNPQQSQEALILELLKQKNVAIQTGGGIRSAETIEKYLAAGAARVIIGSVAVEDPQTALAWFRRFGADRLVLALDVICRENSLLIASNAWQKTSQQSLESLIAIYETVALKHLLCTDISRDGTLQGPGAALYESLLAQFPSLQIQASGGIQSVADLVLLRDKGCSGAITGRALYENKFSLSEALSC